MPDDILTSPPPSREDLTPQGVPPPTPIPVQQQVQDIFGDSEPITMSASPTATSPSSTETRYNPYATPTQSGTNRKTTILIVGAIVALLVIVGVIVLIFTLVKPKPTTTVTPVPVTTPQEQPTTVPTTPPVEQPVDIEPVPTEQPVTPPSSTPSDSDSDGLTDDEEVSLGTDPYLPDTDNDMLWDREEVKVYMTNPLNADTDGDGFLDGEEVRNNYNPNGPGSLYTTP